MNDKAARRPRKDGPPTGEPTAGDRSGDGDRTGTPVLTGGIPPRDAALLEVPPERTAPPKPAGDGAAGAGEGAADDGADATRDVVGPNRVIGLVKNEAAQAGVFEQVRQTTLEQTGVDIATADDDVAHAAIEKGLRNEAVEQHGAGVVFDPGRVIGSDPRNLTDSELQDKLGLLAADHEAGALLDKDPADITPEDRRGLADAIHRAELEHVLGIPADRATTTETFLGEQLLRNRGAGFDVTDEQARLNELVNRNPGRSNGGGDDDGPFIGGDSTGGGTGGGNSSGDPGGNRPPGGGGGNNDIGPRPGDDGGGGRPGAGTEPPAASGPPAGSQAFDVRSGETTERSDGTSTSSEFTETFYRTPDGQWVDANGNPVDEGTAQALEDGTLGERNPQRDPAPSGGSGSGSGNGSGGSGDSGGSGSGGGSGSDGSGSGSGGGNDTDSGTEGDDSGSGSGTDTNSGGDDDDPDTELTPDPESDLDLPPGLEDVFNRFDMVGQGIANLRAQQTASGATPDSTPDPTNTVPLGAPNLGNANLGLVGNDQRGVDSGPPILGGNTTPSFGGQAGAIDPGPDASIGSATGPELEIEIPVADGAAAHLLDDDLPPLAGSDDSDDDQDDDGDLAAD